MSKAIKNLCVLLVLFWGMVNLANGANIPTFSTDGIQPDTAEPKHTVAIDSQRIDRLTAIALQALTEGELDVARNSLQNLVNDYPSYRLGHLLFAELHAANTVLPSSLSRSQYTQEFMELLLEASSRLAHSKRLSKTTFSEEDLPSDILKLGKGLKHWVQVELEQGVQSVFEVEKGRLTKRWEQYIGYGAGGFDKFEEGDLKTPLGVYRIDGFRDDASLPELYGSGALTLDYPNLSDVYENRTGSGIWLHGVPRSNRSRGPLSSEGCVIMGNDYLSTLHTLVDPDSTLVALSAHSAIQNPNVDLSALEKAFHHWQFQQANINKSHSDFVTTKIQWSDITVVLSGAGSINGEPQNVTMYFPIDHSADHSTDNSINSSTPFKALFWQRKTPGANTWELVGDETKKSRA